MFLNFRTKRYHKELKANIEHIEAGRYQYFMFLLKAFATHPLRVKIEAARYLCSALEKFSADEITKVDMAMRLPLYDPADWKRLDIKDLTTIGLPDDLSRAVWIFASFSPNGYLREKAVRALAQYALTLPYILLRLNDWVKEVRMAASAAFERRLKEPSPGELSESLFFIKKLIRGGRDGHDVAVKAFFRALREHPEELERGFADHTPSLRLLCTEAVLAAESPDFERILRYLKTEKSSPLRGMTYRMLLAHEKFDSGTIPDRLLRDKSAKIRTYGLLEAYKRFPDRANAVALTLLSDKSRTVQETARWVVSRFSADFDFRSYYLNHLETSPDSSIAGLGDTGRPEDAVRIMPFLNSPKESCVRTTMCALMRLDAPQYKRRIAGMLANDRHGIVKTAFSLLQKYGFEEYLDEIESIFRETRNRHSRLNCAKLLFSTCKWTAIAHILSALSDQDEAISALADIYLRLWLNDFNRMHTLPPEEAQQTLLQQLLEQQKSYLDDHLFDHLCFCIKKL